MTLQKKNNIHYHSDVWLNFDFAALMSKYVNTFDFFDFVYIMHFVS